jgi:NADH dehydrogenase FAD-containing subunit
MSVIDKAIAAITPPESDTARAEATHVVVVGGGFGRLACAKALARSPVRVTLLDREDHYCFQPLLYPSTDDRPER